MCAFACVQVVLIFFSNVDAGQIPPFRTWSACCVRDWAMYFNLTQFCTLWKGKVDFLRRIPAASGWGQTFKSDMTSTLGTLRSAC